MIINRDIFLPYYLGLAILVFSGSSSLEAQDLDSIAFKKHKSYARRYKLQSLGLSEFKLKNGAPIKSTPISSAGKLAGNLFSRFTGQGNINQQNDTWEIENQLKIKRRKPPILYKLIVPGLFVRTREVIKDEEGKKRVETTDRYELYWDERVTGICIEKSDTFAAFELNLHDQTDEFNTEWRLMDKNLNSVKKWLNNTTGSASASKFIIKGELYDEDFSLFTNYNYYRSHLYVNGKLAGIWQGTPARIFSNKKNKILPYIKLDPDTDIATKQKYLYLLALTETIYNSIISTP